MHLGFYNGDGPYSPPHPAVALPILLIVETAVRRAWELIVKHPRPGFNMATADEDTITHELYEALSDRVFKKGLVEGFDENLFCSVEREPKLRSHNYRHLDKMPDLVVRLIGRPPGVLNSQDGLFIECKPVDSKHGVQGHYCAKGIDRFVRGEYAWAMIDAMMVGYTKKGYTISGKLIPVLAQSHHCSSKAALVSASAVARQNGELRSILTRHTREFRYRETDQQAPEIGIRHIWLTRD